MPTTPIIVTFALTSIPVALATLKSKSESKLAAYKERKNDALLTT